MEKCFIKDCTREGTEYRDRTSGPLGDFRYYCKEHVNKADLEAAVSDANRSLSYAKSLVDNAIKEYERTCNRVTEAQNKLLAAKIKLIEEA